MIGVLLMNHDCLFQELRESGNYSGPCVVAFDDPIGEIRGTATVRIGQDARAEAEVSIEEFQAPPEYGDNLLAFLNASPPKRQGEKMVVSIPASADERRIVSLTVESEEGIFSASSGILITPVLLGFQAKETLSLILNDLAFSPKAGKVAKYWFLPLVGPFGEHYLRRASGTHPIALDGEGFVTFSVDGLECGLQIFDPSKKPSHHAASYDALAFGEVRGAPSTLQETWDTLPRGLVEALSFAVGADVTAPWFELRGDDGSLIQRYFFRVGHRSAPEGFAAFSKVNEFRSGSGIGAFLKAFFALAQDKRAALIPPLNLIRSGAPGSFNIEDSITDLMKVLDNLCKARGFVTQDLLGRLDQDNQQSVVSILAEARKGLGVVLAENTAKGRQEQTDVLNTVVSRVANATSKSRDFGIAVKDLLTDLGLQDAEVLDLHYGSLGLGQSWAGILSAVRGEVIHNGFLRIKDVRSLRSWFEFARHLHDLCKRIILREAKYGGLYQASTNPWQGEYAVDRVKPATSVKDLGFSHVPTQI
jgi:hypothetical protein